MLANQVVTDDSNTSSDGKFLMWVIYCYYFLTRLEARELVHVVCSKFKAVGLLKFAILLHGSDLVGVQFFVEFFQCSILLSTVSFKMVLTVVHLLTTFVDLLKLKNSVLLKLSVSHSCAWILMRGWTLGSGLCRNLSPYSGPFCRQNEYLSFIDYWTIMTNTYQQNLTHLEKLEEGSNIW